MKTTEHKRAVKKAWKENNNDYKQKQFEYRRTDFAKYRVYVNNLKFKYNISEQEVRDLMDSQSGCCAICGNSLPIAGLDSTHSFAIDHCHETGVVRGLLCYSCNVALGHLRDSYEIVRRAADYLGLSTASAMIGSNTESSSVGSATTQLLV